MADLTTQTPSVGDLTLVLKDDGSAAKLFYNSATVNRESAIALVKRFSVFLDHVINAPDTSVSSAPVLTPAELNEALIGLNETDKEYEDNTCIHHFFERQVLESPDAIAVAFEEEQISYRTLNQKANRLAHHLQQMGIGPESRVAICTSRSIEMMVGLLGILKAGAAYVPMDPSYPSERLAFMLADSGAAVLVAQEHLARSFDFGNVPIVSIEGVTSEAATLDHSDNPDTEVSATNLAYLIYTSGSTGRPKGVMITHRNVANFFAAMDSAIWDGRPGVWLAVTTMSFDISVLELFWTLARGFKVVLHQADLERSRKTRTVRAGDPMQLSLAYFASNSGENADDPYRLLMEGAKYADANGFAAVWTPERHFHAFGGLYPNPSVTSAALAAITTRVNIRAGSVVLPLHNPIRVAEEWSLVDNISKGRVGISFASGWHSQDFVFAPENYTDRKDVMLRNIEVVRQLWRGEKTSVRGGDGRTFEVGIVPKPVQSELPVWITAAGHPDTFKVAGEMGANLLTHLLGQSIEELAEKISIYRRSLQGAGRAADSGKVTLMLHTFLGDNLDEVREAVREPLSNYLKNLSRSNQEGRVAVSSLLQARCRGR